MRKSYTGKFKVKVVIDVIREQVTVKELSSKYQIHRSLLTRWKKEAIEGLSGIFSASGKKDKQGVENGGYLSQAQIEKEEQRT